MTSAAERRLGVACALSRFGEAAETVLEHLQRITNLVEEVQGLGDDFFDLDSLVDHLFGLLFDHLVGRELRGRWHATTVPRHCTTASLAR
jgi:hypothetical protein